MLTASPNQLGGFLELVPARVLSKPFDLEEMIGAARLCGGM